MKKMREVSIDNYNDMIQTIMKYQNLQDKLIKAYENEEPFIVYNIVKKFVDELRYEKIQTEISHLINVWKTIYENIRTSDMSYKDKLKNYKYQDGVYRPKIEALKKELENVTSHKNL